MQAISKAALQFGLVSIAVKVYAASSPQSISFNWLTKKHNRVCQKMFDSQTQEEIKRSDVVNGFEVEKDKYVIFSQEELTIIKKQKVAGDYIEVCEAVKQEAIALIALENSYHLLPNKSDRPYRLLCQALVATRKMLVAKWYRANKDNLVVITADQNQLMMYQLYYENERRTIETNFAEGSEPSKEELKLAKMMLMQMSTPTFDISKYKDEYHERLMAAIEEKKKGQTIYSEQQIEQGKDLLDLVSQLKKSVEKKK